VSLYASFNGTLGTTIYAPEHAFDGDISTMWMHDIAGAFWRTWIGLDFTGHNVAYCVKQMRIYQATSYDLELQYYDEDEHEWVTTDSDIDGTGDDWVELDVNGNDVFAYKWRLQFPMGTVGGLKELELYGVPYNPLMAGFNKDNEKIYELSDDGLRIFNDRFFMNNNQAAVIIDQGSNDNGSYVKWSNGLQICWGSNTFPSEGWTGSGDKWYLTGQSLTLPATFDSVPTFFGTTQDASIAARSAKLANFVARVNVGTSNVTNIAFNGWGTASNDFILHWLAIGWWK